VTGSSAAQSKDAGLHSPGAQAVADRPPFPVNDTADGNADGIADDVLGLQRIAGNQAVKRLLGPGRRLDVDVRSELETAIGVDLSGVRLHTGVDADRSARAAGALAYTAGQDIVFAAGQYDPGSTAGRWVLAHELAHVAQQSAARGSPGRAAGPAGDGFERAAQAVAARLANRAALAGRRGALPASTQSRVPAVQKLDPGEQQRQSYLDELAASMTMAFYGDPQAQDTDLLIKGAGKLQQSFEDPKGPRSQLASARALLQISQVLDERARSSPKAADGALLRRATADPEPVPWTADRPVRLDQIWPFTPDNAAKWLEVDVAGSPADASGPRKPGRLAPAAPVPTVVQEAARRVTAGQTQGLSRLVGGQLREQTQMPTEKEAAGAGGGAEVAKGLAALRGATVGEAKLAVRQRAEEVSKGDPRWRGVRVVGGAKGDRRLLDEARMIWYVTTRVYVLDNTGHLVPGDFYFNLTGTSKELKPGTYYFSRYALGLPNSEMVFNGYVLIRLDGSASVAFGDLLPATVTQDLIPLLKKARATLDDGGGIGIIVSSSISQGRAGFNLRNLAPAVHRAVRHLNYAIQAEARRILDNPLQEATQQLAMGIAMEALTGILGELATRGIAVLQAGELGFWLGETASLAAWARNDDELDIAAQAIARKLAEFVVGRAVAETISGGTKLGRRVMAARRKPPTPGLEGGPTRGPTVAGEEPPTPPARGGTTPAPGEIEPSQPPTARAASGPGARGIQATEVSAPPRETPTIAFAKKPKKPPPEVGGAPPSPTRGGGGSGDLSGPKPEFRPNPARQPGRRGFGRHKTLEPTDARRVYDNAVKGPDGVWYGRGSNGEIYRFSPDRAGGAHFSGMTGPGAPGGPKGIRLDDIPIEIRRRFERVR